MTWLGAAVVTAFVSAVVGIAGAVFIWRGMPRESDDGMTITMVTRDRKTLVIALLSPCFAALSAACSLVALATGEA